MRDGGRLLKRYVTLVINRQIDPNGVGVVASGHEVSHRITLQPYASPLVKMYISNLVFPSRIKTNRKRKGKRASEKNLPPPTNGARPSMKSKATLFLCFLELLLTHCCGKRKLKGKPPTTQGTQRKNKNHCNGTKPTTKGQGLPFPLALPSGSAVPFGGIISYWAIWCLVEIGCLQEHWWPLGNWSGGGVGYLASWLALSAWCHFSGLAWIW